MSPLPAFGGVFYSCELNGVHVIVAWFKKGLPMSRNDASEYCSLTVVRASGSLRKGAVTEGD